MDLSHFWNSTIYAQCELMFVLSWIYGYIDQVMIEMDTFRYYNVDHRIFSMVLWRLYLDICFFIRNFVHLAYSSDRFFYIFFFCLIIKIWVNAKIADASTLNHHRKIWDFIQLVDDVKFFS